jgi:hypothetical protein
MLTQLAVFLLMMLVACTLSLVICWVYDSNIAAFQSGELQPVVLGFPVPSHKRRFRAIAAARCHRPAARPRIARNEPGEPVISSRLHHDKRGGAAPGVGQLRREARLTRIAEGWRFARHTHPHGLRRPNPERC